MPQATAREQARIDSLLELMPHCGRSVLDIGSRDARVLSPAAERFHFAVAADLSLRTSHRPAVAGDVRSLPFRDHAFDGVICTEVLEHLPPSHLAVAAAELRRVAQSWLLIGVPNEQDLRAGRLWCAACRTVNPPWGHLSTFSSRSLCALFQPFLPTMIEQVWPEARVRLTTVSDLLMRMARYPYGTYEQEETCLWCGRPFTPPTPTLWQRVLARMALRLTSQRVTPTWIHAVFLRPGQ